MNISKNNDTMHICPNISCPYHGQYIPGPFLFLFLITLISFFPKHYAWAKLSDTGTNRHIIKRAISFPHLSPGSAEEIFFEAGKAYKKGRFRKAIEKYNLLIKSGYINGHIYYNLGNAWFRLNRIGRAILNYERAKILIPRDPDLKFNLSYAQKKTIDEIPHNRDILHTIFFWLDSLNLHEVFYTFAIINILFWGMLVAYLFFKKDWIYYILITFLILWLISGSSCALKWYWIQTDNRAVILAKEESVLAGPHEGDTILFKLHEGAIVHYERSEDGWTLIHISIQKRGWIKNSDLGRIKDFLPIHY